MQFCRRECTAEDCGRENGKNLWTFKKRKEQLHLLYSHGSATEGGLQQLWIPSSKLPKHYARLSLASQGMIYHRTCNRETGYKQKEPKMRIDTRRE